MCRFVFGLISSAGDTLRAMHLRCVFVVFFAVCHVRSHWFGTSHAHTVHERLRRSYFWGSDRLVEPRGGGTLEHRPNSPSTADSPDRPRTTQSVVESVFWRHFWVFRHRFVFGRRRRPLREYRFDRPNCTSSELDGHLICTKFGRAGMTR